MDTRLGQFDEEILVNCFVESFLLDYKVLIAANLQPTMS